MTQISRRNVARGAAWTAPAIVVGAAAPALAASGCSATGTAAIDAAFASVANSLVAYWTLDTAGQSNGTGGSRPYLNIINNSPYDLNVSGTPLTVTLDAYYLDAAKSQWTSTLVSTSYGSVSSINPATYNGHKAGQWTWSAGSGNVILSNKSGNDNVADMVFTNPGSLTASPGGTVVCATLTSAPQMAPTFASVKAQNPAVTDACQAYYSQKLSVTPVIAFSGPRLSGTTPWNTDGVTATLPGGSTSWSVGSAVCSNAVGNYISSTNPPSAGGAAVGTDGIF